jgi:hypothetical protein
MKKGHDRVVVILPELGIVLKFPIIHFRRFFSSFAYCFRSRKRVVSRFWLMLTAPIRYPFGFSGMLFKGIWANWCEFWFYQQTRNVFLQPTYFSLFGLMNVQPIGKPCLMKVEDVWCQLCELSKSLEKDLWKDNHHFANPENFGFYKDKIRMFDYGSKASREVIALHGTYIVEHFNPAYSRENAKRQL